MKKNKEDQTTDEQSVEAKNKLHQHISSKK